MADIDVGMVLLGFGGIFLGIFLLIKCLVEWRDDNV